MTRPLAVSRPTLIESVSRRRATSAPRYLSRSTARDMRTRGAVRANTVVSASRFHTSSASPTSSLLPLTVIA
jgi:hypothetical protein